MIVLILYSLLLIPLLLNFWDLELYGTWLALYAFFNLINVIEYGHGVYVGNEFNRIVHTDVEKSKVLLGSALRANFLGGSLQIIVVLVFYYLGLFRYFLDENIDDSTVVTILLILFTYRMLIGSFRGIIVKILNPFGLIYKSFQYATLEKGVEFIVFGVSAALGFSLIQLALIWFVGKFIYSIFILFNLKKMLPEYFPWWKYGNFKIGIRNFRKSFSYAASNFLDRLGHDGITLIVSALVGSSFLPLFSATKTIVNFGIKLSEFIIKPVDPEMINLFAKNKLKKIVDIFKVYWFVTGFILMLGFAVSLLFIEDLFTFWTNGKLEFNMMLYCSLVIILLLKTYGMVLVLFFTGINRLRIVLLTSVFRVALFFLIVYLVKDYELYGVLFALFLSELLVVMCWLPYNAFKLFDLTFHEKITFYVYLFALLFLGVLFYLYTYNLIYSIFIFSFIAIISILFYQYKLISLSSRNIIKNKLKTLFSFLPIPKSK